MTRDTFGWTQVDVILIADANTHFADYPDAREVTFHIIGESSDIW